ncbi:hypothetical protein L9F63_000703, partial [Diploptera punctata]
ASLTKQRPIAEWTIEPERTEMTQYLTLKQVMLGVDAKEEEQVVTIDLGDMITIPIARLKKGSLEMWSMDIKTSMCPLKIYLIKGSGPVHVLGVHTLDMRTSLMAAETDSECLDEDEMGVECEDENEEEEEVVEKVPCFSIQNLQHKKKILSSNQWV